MAAQGAQGQEEADLPKATHTLNSSAGTQSWSGVPFPSGQEGRAALGAGRLPASVQRPVWGSPSGSPWPASRKLQILGCGPEGEERGFSMLLIVPMTGQEQSAASRCLLPPASAQLFWPRCPISPACLREHWAFVSSQKRGCVLRALRPTPSPCSRLSGTGPQSQRPSCKSPNPSPSEAKALVHHIELSCSLTPCWKGLHPFLI